MFHMLFITMLPAMVKTRIIQKTMVKSEVRNICRTKNDIIYKRFKNK